MKLWLANQILHNKIYIRELEALGELEKERKFCRHDMEHFLSVARITVLLCHERGVDADEDMIYSAALLHDMGRIAEFREGVPHDIAGIAFAEKILAETDCSAAMKLRILSLIANHRNTDDDDNSLERIFYTADKRSRRCFACSAWDECNWPMEKRNTDIKE